MEIPEYNENDDQWIDVVKPYENEHAFRLKSPGLYKRFRRQNNKFGSGRHAIFGVRKSDNKVELQAIRIDAKKYTYAQAKQWVKDHGYKPILSEPASGGKMKPDKEQFLTYVKGIPEEGPIPFRLTELRVDRGGEVVKPDGIDLKYFKGNPIVLFAHGFGNRVPIGKVLPESIEQTDTYLDAKVQFDEDGLDPFARMIADKVRNKFLRSGSIGFISKKRSNEDGKEPLLKGQTGVTHEKSELLEFSIVPIGMLQTSGAKREWEEFTFKCAELGHEIELDWIKDYYEDKTSGTIDTLTTVLDAYDIKEGRVLSGKNRKLVEDAYGILIVAAEALDSLLKATEKPDKELEPIELIEKLEKLNINIKSLSEALDVQIN